MKEYLTGERIRNGPVELYSFNRQIADKLIAQTCLAYLVQFDKMDSLDPTTPAYFPLAYYAAQFWFTHVQSQSQVNTTGDTLQHLMMDLLEPDSALYFNWIQLHDIDRAWKGL